jgi:hypothetical protein
MNRSKSALLGVLTAIATATLTCCFVGQSKVSAGAAHPAKAVVLVADGVSPAPAPPPPPPRV